MVKANYTKQVSPAILKEVRMALSRRKKPEVPAGSRSTAPGRGGGAPLRPSRQLVGKRKTNELASSGGSPEPANRHPAPSEGSAPLPASTSAVTGEQAASSSRQLGPPEGGATYAAVLAGPVTPFQPSGSLKPTAMDSEMSESAVSPETVNRRMSSYMSGPLSDMPDGTTIRVQVANTCLPAGELPNKTPIFISGVRDTRAFLAWLRVSCPGGLAAQLKAEKLMVVPLTGNGFRATVSALRSLDGGVSFHTFTLPEDGCVRLLVKNLGRGMPERVVREEMEAMDIHVQGFMQLRSGRRDQDPTKDRPLTPPPPHFIVSVAWGPEWSKVRSITKLCGLRVS
jgi:hypothetical protein